MKIAFADIHILSICSLLFILSYILITCKNRRRHTRYFMLVLIANLIMLFIDMNMVLLNGVETPFAAMLNRFFITSSFAFSIIPSVTWLIYFDYRIFRTHKITDILLYMIPPFIIWILLIANLSHPFMFTVSKTNYYERGLGLVITILLSYALLAFYTVKVLRYKSSIEGRFVLILISFAVFPVVGALLQLFNLGLTAIWSFYSLVPYFAFILIEKEDLLSDPLTGMKTRGQLENRLRYKLNRSTPFSMILIDLDEFKNINDRYGHLQGDLVLKCFAELLKNNVRENDLSCRLGGDEFAILVESDDPQVAKQMIDRLTRETDLHNRNNDSSYRVHFSNGIHFIEDPKSLDLFDVIDIIDQKMYDDKNKKIKSPL